MQRKRARKAELFLIAEFLLQYLIQMIINMGMDLTLEFGWTGWSWYNGTEMAMNATDAILNVTSIIN